MVHLFLYATFNFRYPNQRLMRTLFLQACVLDFRHIKQQTVLFLTHYHTLSYLNNCVLVCNPLRTLTLRGM